MRQEANSSKHCIHFLQRSKPWSSLVEGDEDSCKPNCKTDLVSIDQYELYLLLWQFIHKRNS